tara:strand:+ start:394 stop:714 length:321 start_codon:yes stop_codon:yes gene_type:complete
MQLFVSGMNSIKGFPTKTVVLNSIKKTDTIRTIKLIIANKYNLKLELFYFVYAGKILESKHSIEKYNILKESTLHIMFRPYCKERGECIRCQTNENSNSSKNAIEI